MGKKVFTSRAIVHNAEDLNHAELNLSVLPSGMYVINVSNDNEFVSTQIIIAK